MKTLPHWVLAHLVLVLAGVVLLAGCSTPDARIKENPEAFDRGTPQQQELIKQGKIAVGFDEEMVKLALGDPDRITTHTDAAGESQVWHYVTYETDDGVLLYTGYYHRFRGPVLYPYYLDYPARTEHDRFRVVFKDGKVVAIEEETN
jgi:outer membrane protein assembly factor BamE (lipoprotein component of BamABCDE complex)